jgi:hypothetical protein
MHNQLLIRSPRPSQHQRRLLNLHRRLDLLRGPRLRQRQLHLLRDLKLRRSLHQGRLRLLLQSQQRSRLRPPRSQRRNTILNNRGCARALAAEGM